MITNSRESVMVACGKRNFCWCIRKANGMWRGFKFSTKNVISLISIHIKSIFHKATEKTVNSNFIYKNFLLSLLGYNFSSFVIWIKCWSPLISVFETKFSVFALFQNCFDVEQISWVLWELSVLSVELSLWPSRKFEQENSRDTKKFSFVMEIEVQLLHDSRFSLVQFKVCLWIP